MAVNTVALVDFEAELQEGVASIHRVELVVIDCRLFAGIELGEILEWNGPYFGQADLTTLQGFPTLKTPNEICPWWLRSPSGAESCSLPPRIAC